MWGKSENKEKEAGFGPFLKKFIKDTTFERDPFRVGKKEGTFWKSIWNGVIFKEAKAVGSYFFPSSIESVTNRFKAEMD